MKVNLTWDNVFNCQRIYPSDYNECRKVAKAREYEYMAFDGRVYSVDDPYMSHVLIDDSLLDNGVTIDTEEYENKVATVPLDNLVITESAVMDAFIEANNALYYGDSDRYEDTLMSVCLALSKYCSEDIGKIELSKYRVNQ